MIWGKTRRYYQERHHWFAWHPVKLNSGRRAWGQYVWRWDAGVLGRWWMYEAIDHQ